MGGGPGFPEGRHSPRWGEQGCTHLSPLSRFPWEGLCPGAFSSLLSESHLGRLGIPWETRRQGTQGAGPGKPKEHLQKGGYLGRRAGRREGGRCRRLKAERRGRGATRGRPCRPVPWLLM